MVKFIDPKTDRRGTTAAQVGEDVRTVKSAVMPTLPRSRVRARTLRIYRQSARAGGGGRARPHQQPLAMRPLAGLLLAASAVGLAAAVGAAAAASSDVSSTLEAPPCTTTPQPCGDKTHTFCESDPGASHRQAFVYHRVQPLFSRLMGMRTTPQTRTSAARPSASPARPARPAPSRPSTPATARQRTTAAWAASAPAASASAMPPGWARTASV